MHSSAKQPRRKLLKDTWYFHCECEKCVDNAEHLLTSILCPQCPAKGVNPIARLCLFGRWPYKDEESQRITCPQCGTQISQQEVMEGLAAMRFIGDLLEGKSAEPEEEKTLEGKRTRLRGMLVRFESILPRVNVYVCKLIQALVPLIPIENNAELLQLHLESEECVRLCYPHNHPALGFHLRNIGIFGRNLGHTPQALKYLREAVDIFEFTMGKEHQLAQATRQMLEETERDAVVAEVGKMSVTTKEASNGDGKAVEKKPVNIPIVVVCESSGVKKKASMKKVSPRARTPLPVNLLMPGGDGSGVESSSDVERGSNRNKLVVEVEGADAMTNSLIVPELLSPPSLNGGGLIAGHASGSENDGVNAKSQGHKKKRSGKR